jgi:hypothetical protein
VRIFEHKPERTVEIWIIGLRHHIDQIDDADDPTQLEIARNRDAMPSLNVRDRFVVPELPGVNQQRSAIARRPGAILNLFDASDDQMRPWLTD